MPQRLENRCRLLHIPLTVGNHFERQMMKTTIFLISIFLFCNNVVGQAINDVRFNHLSFTLEYQDLEALRESSFVQDKLGVLETRTTKVDSITTITRNFLYGESNYLELFETSADDPTLGFLTLVLSVDKINGLYELKKNLDNSYQTGIRGYERNFDGVKVPWYESLSVIDTSILDSAYMIQAHFWFWIMGYKTEYFEYNGYAIENDKLTSENYLEKYASERQNKIIKRFSGIVMKLNPDETEYLKKFFETIGYLKLDENEYLSPEKFKFIITERQPGDHNSLESIEFETSKEFSRKKEVMISDHMFVIIQGNKGHIIFN